MEIFLSERSDRVSPKTLAAYQAALTHFFSLLPTPPEEASTEALSDVLSTLCRSASRPTLARMLTVLRGYYGSLCRRGVRQDDPTKALTSADFSPRPTVVADEAVFAALMATPFLGIRGRRDRLMLLLLWEMPLSVSALVKLRRGDFCPATAALRVGNTETPLSAALTRRMTEYLAVTALVRKEAEAPLFINEAGQGISRQGFWKNVKARARLAGLPEEYTLLHFRREKNKIG